MQYFTNARLELHPDVHTAQFTVLLGLLGDELLRTRGWVTSQCVRSGKSG